MVIKISAIISYAGHGFLRSAAKVLLRQILVFFPFQSVMILEHYLQIPILFIPFHA